MQFSNGLRALDHRDFRLFWTGQLVSLVGTWMQSIGQSWLVLELTNSPFKLGLINTLQFLPVLLFGLFAGAITDRLAKRRLILFTQTGMMLLAFALAALVWSGHVQYWHVVVLATLLGVFNTLDMPARQAFVVEMVGKEDLMNAIALNSAMFNGARLVGPWIAGLLIAHFSIGSAFFVNGTSFLAVLAALLAIKAEGLPRPNANKASLVHDVREGLAYSVRTPLIFLTLGLMFAVGLFVINWGVLIPLLAKNVLHKQVQGYGYLMSAMGAGSLLGAILLALQGRKKPRVNVVTGIAIIVCVATMAIAFIHESWTAGTMLFIVGAAQILYTAMTNTLLQVSVPDGLRGRVMSLYQIAFAGTTPVGSFLMGIITERWSVPAGFLVAGGGGLLSVLAMLAYWWMVQARRPATAEGES